MRSYSPTYPHKDESYKIMNDPSFRVAGIRPETTKTGADPSQGSAPSVRVRAMGYGMISISAIMPSEECSRKWQW
ncbi:hypothetical protein GCM10009560_26660 [Nonomuraea longicatena]|uniref:Uncharacterized protein n=1 Tax=Nonomuraea longicatena TaxID=83682 RepID=A0ABN1PAC3_9ACTN